MGFSRSNRSVSLPSRPNPTSTPEFHEHVSCLRSSETASTSSFSSSIISHKLAKLGDLYDFVDTMLLVPQNQLALRRGTATAKHVDDLLDGSVRLLDICGNSRDVLLQMKDRLQEVQSALRRRTSESSISAEVARYVSMRKSVEKVIRTCLKGHVKPPCVGSTGTSVVGMLSEVETVSVEVFTSLLSYIGARKSWSMVSKLMIQQDARTEFESVDAALSFFAAAGGHWTNNGNFSNMINVENLRNQIVKLELVVQEFVELLEFLFRRLVKTRAAVLNILSH